MSLWNWNHANFSRLEWSDKEDLPSAESGLPHSKHETSLQPPSSKMLTYASLLSLVALLQHALAAPILEDRAISDRFTLYDLPTALTGPCDLEVGQDGASWGQVRAFLEDMCVLSIMQ
jgi:hypothetical protein